MFAFSLFGLRLAAGSTPLHAKWSKPTLRSRPLFFKNAPVIVYDLGNSFLIHGIVYLVHLDYFDSTIAWAVATILGIGLGLHGSILVSAKWLASIYTA